MAERFEIKGRPDQFEAAVLAVVIDKIARDDESARQRRGASEPGLPAWVRAMSPKIPGQHQERIWPE